MSSVVISGDTSGSITIAAPAVSGTNTLTLPASTGTVMVNGPAFSAYQSSAQTPSANTFTKILFQTEEFDTNNNFASSTFTPTVAGYYQINLTATSSALNLALITIYKNGSIYKNVGQTNGTPYGASVSCLIYCNGSTDYIEGYIYISTSTATLATIQTTYINGAMVRSA